MGMGVWIPRLALLASLLGMLLAAGHGAWGLAFLFFCLAVWSWIEIVAAKRERTPRLRGDDG